MLKKIFFILAAFLLSSTPAFAQQTARKVLVLVNTHMDDRLTFGTALWRILDLKKNGVDVHAVFEGESVAFFLGQDIRIFEKPANIVDDLGISTECVQGVPAGMSCRKFKVDGGYISKFAPIDNPAPGLNVVNQAPKIKVNLAVGKGEAKKEVYASGQEVAAMLMGELDSLKVPYTLCSLSATQLGVYDKLKQRGLPLSADPGSPVGLVSFINDGYQIINY